MKRGKTTKKPGSGSQKSGDSKSKTKGGNDADDNADDSEEEEDDSEEEEDEEGGGEGGSGSKSKKDDKEGDEEEDEDSEPDLETLPDSTKRYIKNLRKENARYRTKANKFERDYTSLSGRVKSLAGGEDEETAEERMDRLEAESNALAFDNAILRAATKNGINDDEALEYFQFQVGKAMQALEDDEELDEDAISEIADKVKKRFGGGGSNRTSVDSRNAGKGTKTGEGMTAEKLAAMTVIEKQEYRRKNPEKYDQLWKDCIKKGLISFKR